jgi:hypothetical protein
MSFLRAALVLGAVCSAGRWRADADTPTIHFAPPQLNPWKESMALACYPDASMRAKERGEVILHFKIGADGIAQEPFVLDEATTGARRLIEAAEKLFHRTHYAVGDHYRHEVTASVLFEIMPCGALKATLGLDYYLSLCIPPKVEFSLPTP